MAFYIFSGHFGSGKTEVALNFAIRLRQQGKKVNIVDLDIVNPYFRTADARGVLSDAGITLIASSFANSNVDLPTVPADLNRVFCETDTDTVFDVGGDEDGAYALGQYNRFFLQNPYEMFFVANTKRPMTPSAEELIERAGVISAASRLKFSGIINNTNLGAWTDEDTLMSDYEELLEMSRRTGIPIRYHSGLPKALSGLPKEEQPLALPMQIFIKMPWQTEDNNI